MELNKHNLNKYLNYDPETGILSWKPRDISDFDLTNKYSPSNMCETWNAKFANKPVAVFEQNGYLRFKLPKFFNVKSAQRVHRIIWILLYDEHPDTIDHINRDRSDNRLINLRNVSMKENLNNKSMQKNNKSGVVGVSYDKRSGKWRVKYRGMEYGSYADFEEAKKVRYDAENGLHPL